MARFKVIDHSSGIEEILNPIAKYARQLRETALVIDTETTDSSAECEVIELSIVRAKDGAVLFDQQFKPTKKIEYHAQKIHGIRDAELRNNPTVMQKWDEVLSLLNNQIVMAWNAPQDRRFIASTCARYGLAEPDATWECAMALYRQFKGLSKNCTLTDACEAMRVKTGNHRAVTDALAAARVLYRMADSATEDEVIGFANDTEIEDADEMALTVRNFLCSFGWKEKHSTIKSGGASLGMVVTLWADPLTGREMSMNHALDMQRGRM